LCTLFVAGRGWTALAQDSHSTSAEQLMQISPDDLLHLCVNQQAKK
jgi:hypothetical protein